MKKTMPIKNEHKLVKKKFSHKISFSKKLKSSIKPKMSKNKVKLSSKCKRTKIVMSKTNNPRMAPSQDKNIIWTLLKKKIVDFH